jgi:enoyl-CoA hydratase/carnithine racemase
MAIKREITNGVLWAVIDRPEALNAFDIPDLA